MTHKSQTIPTRELLGDTFETVDAEEGWEILDQAARQYLKMSAEEFLQLYDSGSLPSEAENPNIVYVEMLIPFARQ